MIDVRNLTYTYAGTDKPAVNNISFSVQEGEIFGFLGPSGAGKSTTQKALIGLLQEFQGDITVMGKKLRDWRSDYYERIGVSFESPNHYLKMTALENLAYFSRLYAGRTADPMALLELVGLADSADQPVGSFSKGMKMRLNFVRALLHNPDLLFLDEPTTGLDPVNAKGVKDIILEKKAQGKTVFLTTHNMTVADQLCDRVAFIVNGEISVIDVPKSLKMQYGQREVAVETVPNGSVRRTAFPLDNIGWNEEFINLLRNEPVQTIHTQETTLEQVFIQVTGRRLL